MKKRVETLDPPPPRIFRVDKHKVPEEKVPKALREIQSVRFYREDPHDVDSVDEFFWGGKVRLSVEFDEALLKLTSTVGKRLEQLLDTRFDPKRRPRSRVENARPSNGPLVFVAKPASDMIEYYRTLVEELQGTGFRVTPDPDKDLSSRGPSVVFSALGKAEASIHLLGTRTGGRPPGLDIDLVPMQLSAAAKEAKRRRGFERLIWAPKVLPAATSGQAKTACRDPLKVLKGFGQELLARDKVLGDTASNFNDYVLQRLQERPLSPRHTN